MTYYSISQLKQHNSPEDCWVAIHGKVYNVTKFLEEHPGGKDVLLENAGTDATIEFDNAGHSEDAKEMMKDYQIGLLKKNSCFINDAWKPLIITGVIIIIIFGSLKLIRRRS